MYTLAKYLRASGGAVRARTDDAWGGGAGGAAEDATPRKEKRERELTEQPNSLLMFVAPFRVNGAGHLRRRRCRDKKLRRAQNFGRR